MPSEGPYDPQAAANSPARKPMPEAPRVPIRSTVTFDRRKVPHAGFAAVQDDNRYFVPCLTLPVSICAESHKRPCANIQPHFSF